jgi:hypothetical protein
MQIISGDMLADMRELPFLASSVLALLGLVLYLAGWMTYRFWVVLATTFGAGLYGLRVGPDFGLQPIIAGLLMAVAAGCLALSLARVAIFVWYGLVCWYVVQQFAPQLAVPLVCILAGGLFTVLFHRLCIMMLTSAAGMLLLTYGGLDLADRMAGFSAVNWLNANATTAQITYLASILVGVVVQHMIEKNQKKYRKLKDEYREFQKKKGKETSPKRGVLAWVPSLRKAG